MAAVPTKQYGLILPQKKDGKSNLKKPSVFGDDSDEETTVGECLQKEAIKKKMMKQTRLEMQKALEEDSTVYDYDAVYDDIQKQRSENVKKVLSAADKKPKYIHQLMAAVKDRKKEQDQRKIRKEREAEGDKFSDKEAYITSAYKKKLQEEEEEEERDRRRAEIEAALDVKKQQDLSGFYRHLLNQTIGEEKIPNRAERHESMKASKDAERSSPPPATSPADNDNGPSSGSDSEDGHEHKSVFNKLAAGAAHSKRQYRQRSPTSGSGDDRDRDRDRQRHSKSHRDRHRERDRTRGREREDRHGGRRDDRDRRDDDRDRREDRREERGREDDRDRRDDRRDDRGREDDRSRGRGDAERDDRSGKRGRSPRDRKRNRSGERERRRSSATAEDERKDKEAGEEKERRDEEQQQEEEKKPTGSEATDEKKEEEKKEKEEEEEEDKVNKFAKRSTDQVVSSARDRYMARHMARCASKTYIEKEDD